LKTKGDCRLLSWVTGKTFKPKLILKMLKHENWSSMFFTTSSLVMIAFLKILTLIFDTLEILFMLSIHVFLIRAYSVTGEKRVNDSANDRCKLVYSTFDAR